MAGIMLQSSNEKRASKQPLPTGLLSSSALLITGFAHSMRNVRKNNSQSTNCTIFIVVRCGRWHLLT